MMYLDYGQKKTKNILSVTLNLVYVVYTNKERKKKNAYDYTGITCARIRKKKYKKPMVLLQKINTVNVKK